MTNIASCARSPCRPPSWGQPGAAHSQMSDGRASFTVSAGDERSVEYLDRAMKGPAPATSGWPSRPGR